MTTTASFEARIATTTHRCHCEERGDEAIPRRSAIARSIVRHLAGAALLLSGSVALAQDAYPGKPIRLIVPSSPGGGTDTSARVLGSKMSELLGQPIVIENRPGASTMIGMEAVARSAPDGYTILIDNSTMTILPAVRSKLAADPIRDFTAINKVVEAAQVLVTHPSLPVRNLKDLIALAKAQPGRLDYAAGAPGGNGHLSMELLLTTTGMRIHYVPYRSGNAGLVDTLSGEVPIMMGSPIALLPHVKNGRLRAIGITSPKRASGAPDIPTLAEAGAKGYEATQWFGLFGPAATPGAIVSKLFQASQRALQDADVRRRIVGDGAEPASSASPEAFAAFVKSEVAKWAKVVKAAGIKPH
jgi:tripartite-type tricarboxylate transporter receptor subunit TctC